MEDTEKNIEEMIRDAERVSGAIAEMVHPGDDEIPPISAPRVTEADTIIIYNTSTGAPSKYRIYNAELLRRKLNMKRADGSYIFTTVKPKFGPKIGTFKCLLHKDDTNRAHYDELGFAVCPKDNLSAPFHVRRHMKNRHKVEWAAIEEERLAAEKKEDRDFQRKLMEEAFREKPPLYVSKKDREK